MQRVWEECGESMGGRVVGLQLTHRKHQLAK